MITIDLQDDDANRTKKAKRLEDKNRRRQGPLADTQAEQRDQVPAQGKSGLIARILRLLGNKE